MTARKIILTSFIIISVAAIFLVLAYVPLTLFALGVIKSAEKDMSFLEQYEQVFASTTALAVADETPEPCLDLMHYKYFFTDQGCDSCFARYYRNECLEQYKRHYPGAEVRTLLSPVAETPNYDRRWCDEDKFRRRTIAHLDILSVRRLPLPYVNRESIPYVSGATELDKNLAWHYKRYGPRLGGYLAKRQEGVYFSGEKSFDVTGDGTEELILEVTPWGGNHPPHHAYVVDFRNDVIIATVDLFAESTLLPAEKIGGAFSEKRNGFYIRKYFHDNGMGMPATGERLYRVIYENGTFKPVWEEEVIR